MNNPNNPNNPKDDFNQPVWGNIPESASNAASNAATSNAASAAAKADTGADKWPGVPERHRIPYGVDRLDSATPSNPRQGGERSASARSGTARQETARSEWNQRKALPPRERGIRNSVSGGVRDDVRSRVRGDEK